ncbi:hypothetical protein PI124_g13266 [Phytophthora idaei]|nr:hypothetical protein PI125_g12943 [Phytophthora idaei]KAG3241880.1 hypothetical protein PI124_g13266 [Phytophthora idaei]
MKQDEVVEALNGAITPDLDAELVASSATLLDITTGSSPSSQAAWPTSRVPVKIVIFQLK